MEGMTGNLSKEGRGRQVLCCLVTRLVPSMEAGMSARLPTDMSDVGIQSEHSRHRDSLV